MNRLLIAGALILLMGILYPQQEKGRIENISTTATPIQPVVESYIIDGENTIFDQFSTDEIGYDSYQQILSAGLEQPEFSNGYYINEYKNGAVYFVSTMQYEDDVYLQFTIEVAQDVDLGPYIYSVHYNFVDENNRELFIPTKKGVPTGDGSNNGYQPDLGASFHETFIDPVVLNHYYSDYIEDFNSLSTWYTENNLTDQLEDIVVEFPSEQELNLELLDYNKMKLLYDTTIIQYVDYYNF